MELDGKIALITGAGRGIGKALAIGFAKAGAHVVLVSRTLTEIEATARVKLRILEINRCSFEPMFRSRMMSGTLRKSPRTDSAASIF